MTLSMKFVVGQRWASHTETQLGLGIVTECEDRRVKIIFPASEESRVYASNNAPLSRIKYSEGDVIQDMDDKNYTVVTVHETNDIFSYTCLDQNQEEVEVHEIDLSCFVKFSTPQQRLFSGQIDKNKHFALRVQTLALRHELQQSPIKGLQGSRTNLLPHQVYIAKEVAQRHAPRVLLADEVGLGKTIEAGMILHYQLHTGQASRVLILVPDSLVHQWLVEMLRRFNLHFSIYDEDRVYANMESGNNPFEAEQLILCPLSLLTKNDEFFQYATDTSWDMLIVDEAHHLEWSEDNKSDEYACVEALSHVSQGVLLLTATPEQVGLDNHFARLRLLDPARFHDLEAFKQEQSQYEALNKIVEAIQNESLDSQQQQQLEKYLGAKVNAKENKDTIIRDLLDRHGTGRVLFRNTRSAIKGFPKRIAKPYALEANENLQDSDNINQHIYPETLNSDWLKTDARVTWLTNLLKEHKNEKVLLICHHAETAIALDKHLNLRAGIRSASFYEGLSIIERDRAAAYFAEGSQFDDFDDGGTGAQVLICSEIGSEGRNFQFAHHLVLFDLPLNPDLLEQRIGRLDRIGQQHDIQIHIPYIANSAQESLFRFYHEGMQIFERSCASAYAIFSHFKARLEPILLSKNERTLSELIGEAHSYTNESLQKLQEGRDRLLELNSCKPDIANALIEQIHEVESSNKLSNFMDVVFDQYGVETEYHSEGTLILRPSDHMQAPFPGLKEEGTTITFSREKSLSREDMEFLSWEHPMVSESLGMLLNGDLGNTAIGSIAVKSLPKGLFMLECYYTVEGISHKSLELDRYLPLSPFRLVIGSDNKNYSAVLSHDKVNSLVNNLPKTMRAQIAEQLRSNVTSLLGKADNLVNKETQKIQAKAQNAMQNHLGAELSRLEALRKVNSSVRQSEIDFIKDKIAICSDYIQRTEYQLQAIRIVINNY